MAMFGLGTVPSILATSMFGGLVPMKVRRNLLKLLPVGALMLAALLILRGMSLGIPYVSPKMDTQSIKKHECCN
jgi:uncharacterized protein